MSSHLTVEVIIGLNASTPEPADEFPRIARKCEGGLEANPCPLRIVEADGVEGWRELRTYVIERRHGKVVAVDLVKEARCDRSNVVGMRWIGRWHVMGGDREDWNIVVEVAQEQDPSIPAFVSV